MHDNLAVSPELCLNDQGIRPYTEDTEEIHTILSGQDRNSRSGERPMQQSPKAPA